MSNVPGDPFSLLQQFQEFYATLLSTKEAVLQTYPIPAGSSLPPTPNQQEAESQSNTASITLTKEQKEAATPPSLDSTALKNISKEPGEEDFEQKIAQISIQISSFLRDQETAVLTEFSQYAEQYYLEAQYIMAAYADEFFLNFNWQGRKVWDKFLIEMNLFNSHVSGDLFFDRLDEYLDVTASKSTYALGIIYYAILSLGFQGKYRGKKNALQSVKEYKSRLFLIITGHRSQLDNINIRLYPQTYEQTLTDGNDNKITNPKWWWGGVLVLICSFIILTHLVWRNATIEAGTAMQSILKLESTSAEELNG